MPSSVSIQITKVLRTEEAPKTLRAKLSHIYLDIPSEVGMNRSLLAIIFATALTASKTCSADTFNFTATSNGLVASGQITGNADPTTAGAFDITSGTAIFNGTMATLHTPGTTAGNSVSYQPPTGIQNDPYIYDNVLYPTSSSLLDSSGLLFNVGTDHANFYYSNGSYFYVYDEISSGVPATFTLTSTATPEPSSLFLLGTGFVGVIGMARRKYLRR